MEKVTGIRGIFFKARDPERLAAWYQEQLGVPLKDGCVDFTSGRVDSPEPTGRTVWSIFPANTDYFAPSTAPFMINYRVTSMERMLEQLRRNGVKIEKTEDHDYGRFAWIMDPEGNRIELWEPQG